MVLTTIRIRLLQPLVANARKSFSSSAFLAKARAVPFKLSQTEGEAIFLDWFGRNYLSPSPNSIAGIASRSVRSSFIPFWKGSFLVDTDFRAVLVEKETHNDVRGRRDDEHLSEVKGVVTEGHYEGPDSLVYGSYDYRTQYLKCLSDSSIFDSVELSSLDLSHIEVEPFKIKPQSALFEFKENIHAKEEARVQSFLRSQYPFADEIRSIEVEKSRFTKEAITPIYFPAFIIEYDFMGVQFRAFVCGQTGTVGGERQYSAPKVTALTGTPLGLLQYLAHPSGWTTDLDCLASLSAGALLPAIGIGIAAQYFPVWRAKLRDAARQQRAKTHQARSRFQGWNFQRDEELHRRSKTKHSWWSRRAEGRQSTSGQENRSYQKEEDQEKRSSPASNRATTTTAESYYHLLGLQGKEGKASTEEIKRAFRRSALQNHPDMKGGEANTKEAASAKFRKILNAYKTLRNESKRKAYDKSMGFTQN
mmetsp:Transcript_45174/g.116866  ORF Transcript_45174/g.116866 Transcript_45174/m.116866 type:complete len:476 (-) Transcript_45174:590-2017(-)